MKKILFQRIAKLAILFYAGGSTYLTIEMFFRGYTHTSMFFVGAIAFILVGGINNWFSWNLSILLQMLISATLITVIEFISGFILNILLNLGIWDYSGLPLNLLGQICLPYTGIWFLLSVVAIVLDDVLRWQLFNESKPRYYLF